MSLPLVLRNKRFVPAIKACNRALRKLNAFGHRVQFEAEWGSDPTPEWFDHLMDQHWKWHITRNPLSWERGFFSMLAMRQDCEVLDLCCGGGFFAHHFFSSRAKSIISVDFDATAIAHAKMNFKAANVQYMCRDVRTAMPEGDFDNVVWDAAIEHFTLSEIDSIIVNIKNRISKKNGILSGYTIVEKQAGKSLSHHEYEFKSKEELAALLRRFFSNVRVIQTTTRDHLEVRDNLYFYAAEHELPFDEGWPNTVRL